MAAARAGVTGRRPSFPPELRGVPEKAANEPFRKTGPMFAREQTDIGPSYPPVVGGEDQNFLAMLNPIMRGSREKTFVVRPVSSLFKKASVIGVELKTFFT